MSEDLEPVNSMRETVGRDVLTTLRSRYFVHLWGFEALRSFFERTSVSHGRSHVEGNHVKLSIFPARAGTAVPTYVTITYPYQIMHGNGPEGSNSVQGIVFFFVFLFRS